MATTIGIALGVLISIIIGLKIFRVKQKHAAALNIVFAKYTFLKISKKKQVLIKKKAKELVLASDTTLRGFANEVERYGWYALAMDALEITSQVPENPVWNSVKNPYLAIHPGDSMLRKVCNALNIEYGIDIKISEVKIEKSTSNKEQASLE